jgi:hypothetical protein
VASLLPLHACSISMLRMLSSRSCRPVCDSSCGAGTHLMAAACRTVAALARGDSAASCAPIRRAPSACVHPASHLRWSHRPASCFRTRCARPDRACSAQIEMTEMSGDLGCRFCAGSQCVRHDGLCDETKGIEICRNPCSIEETPHTTQERSPHPRETFPQHLS